MSHNTSYFRILEIKTNDLPHIKVTDNYDSTIAILRGNQTIYSAKYEIKSFSYEKGVLYRRKTSMVGI